MALRAASLLAASVSLLLAVGGCETHKAGADTSKKEAASSTATGDDHAAPASDDNQPTGTPVADQEKKPPTPPPTPPTPPADDVAPAGSSDCAAVIDHVIALQLQQIPEAQRAKVQQVLPQVRAQGLAQCTGKWSKAARDCLAQAKVAQELARCQPLLTQAPGQPAQPDQTQPPSEKPAPTADETPPTADSPAAPPVDDGPDCTRVANNITAIVEKTFGDRAGPRDANVKAFSAQCVHWNSKVRQCFLAASTLNQAKECSRVQRLENMR